MITAGGGGMKKHSWQDVAWLGCLLGSSILGVEVYAFTSGAPRVPEATLSSPSIIRRPLTTTTSTTTTIDNAITTNIIAECRPTRSTRLYSARTGKTNKGGPDEEPVDPSEADTLPAYDSYLETRKDEIDVTMLYGEEVCWPKLCFNGIGLVW